MYQSTQRVSYLDQETFDSFSAHLIRTYRIRLTDTPERASAAAVDMFEDTLAPGERISLVRSVTRYGDEWLVVLDIEEN